MDDINHNLSIQFDFNFIVKQFSTENIYMRNRALFFVHTFEFLGH